MCTAVLPGVVAWHEHVFFRDDLVRKLTPSQAAPLLASQREQAARDATLRKVSALIDRVLDGSAKEPDLGDLVSLRSDLAHAPAISQVTVYPFLANPQLLLWPCIYSCLGIIVMITNGGAYLAGRRKQLLLGGLVYAFYEWPLWVRNFFTGNEGRAVLAYPNFDVGPESFFAQELTILGFGVLLMAAWLQWLHLADEARRASHDASSPFQPKRLENLTDEFARWLVSSVLLGLGFFWFTAFFWNLVWLKHDARYVPSAVLAHVLWGTSWLLLSWKPYIVWRSWIALKSQYIFDAIEAGSTKVADEKLSELAPAREGFAFVGIVGAVVAFLLPLGQAAFGK